MTGKTLKLALALAAGCMIAVPAAGQTVDWQYPAVEGAGAVVPVPDASAEPRGDLQQYKVVFNITQGQPGEGRVSADLAGAARFVNLLALSGMDPSASELVAVVHASATPSVISDAAYRMRFGGPNPNAELIRDLEANGVEVVVCGQAVAGAGFAFNDVMEPVEISISAMTELAERQMQGYALMP